MGEMTVAEYKAMVDARYDNADELSKKMLAAQRQATADAKVRNHWLLVSPTGEIDGLLVRRYAKSATEAFEEFYPMKKARREAAAAGWHIEEDDVNGSRFDADCERRKLEHTRPRASDANG